MTIARLLTGAITFGAIMTTRNHVQEHPATSKAVANPVPSAPATQAAVKVASKKTETGNARAVSAKTSAKVKKAHKKDKPKKIKAVRDSFTMPEADYAKIAELKKKCLQSGVSVKKSELLRAGLLSLSKLSDTALIKAVEQVEIIKTGRPAKG